MTTPVQFQVVLRYVVFHVVVETHSHDYPLNQRIIASCPTQGIAEELQSIIYPIYQGDYVRVQREEMAEVPGTAVDTITGAMVKAEDHTDVKFKAEAQMGYVALVTDEWDEESSECTYYSHVEVVYEYEYTPWVFDSVKDDVWVNDIKNLPEKFSEASTVTGNLFHTLAEAIAWSIKYIQEQQ
jgi:hypothetical protein